MVHDFDPFLWQISGNFGIRWYGLAYLTGFVLSYLFVYKMASTQRSPMPERLVSDYITYGAIGTLVGGRLGYVLFYSPDLLTRFKPDFPFWGALAVNEGGMASHGGMLGVALAFILFARKHRLPVLHIFDLAAVCAPLGIFWGRIANFINGELVGRESSPDFPLGVKFPSDILMWPAEAPEKLKDLAAVVEPLGTPRELWLGWIDRFRVDSVARVEVQNKLYDVIDAIQNGNTQVKEAIAPYLSLRHPSQLYGALGEGLVVFLVLMAVWYKPRKPGVVGAVFVITYAIVRILDEQFRMPDAHIGFQWLGLTRGQWLSIAMLGFGIILLVLWGLRPSLPISGWGRRDR